jgi:hypothetical protein
MTPQLGRAGGGLDPHDQILEINSNSYCQQNVYFAGIYKKQNSRRCRRFKDLSLLNSACVFPALKNQSQAPAGGG